MTEYGQAFYGSDEIGKLIGGQTGDYQTDLGNWISREVLFFSFVGILYRLPKGHRFYDSDEFKRAKKPDDEIAKPLADYSDDELQNKIKSMQAEIDRRKTQNDEILKLARKVCSDNYHYSITKTDFIAGNRDDKRIMHIVKAAIIAGMELQKGRET